MLGFWEKKELARKFDLLVIGGGITGYSAAIDFKSYRPDLRVGVVERSSFETTASSKNAGFACIGSVTEMLSDLKRMGEEAFLDLVRKRWQGLRVLRQRVGDQAMDFNECGGYEVFMDTESLAEAHSSLDRLNKLLTKVVGKEVFHPVTQHTHYKFEGVKGIIQNRYEGQLDPALMMARLQAVARSMDVEEIRAEVKGYAELGEEVHVEVEEGHLRSSQLIIAVNGLASKLLNVSVQPARAQVLITNPIDELGWSGVFHMDEGYYYFRNVGERVLLGGGRNLDFDAEETFSQDTTALIQSKLEEILKNHILPGRTYQIADRWAGTMGVGSVKSPIVEQLSPRVVAAVRLGGMGVAIGSLVGREAAELCL